MMRGGNATIGTWLQFPSADVAEVMGASGYDWVAVDMEHGAFTRAHPAGRVPRHRAGRLHAFRAHRAG